VGTGNVGTGVVGDGAVGDGAVGDGAVRDGVGETDLAGWAIRLVVAARWREGAGADDGAGVTRLAGVGDGPAAATWCGLACGWPPAVSSSASPVTANAASRRPPPARTRCCRGTRPIRRGACPIRRSPLVTPLVSPLVTPAAAARPAGPALAPPRAR
jgi:hypothetical protein